MIKFRTFAASYIGQKYAERGWECQDSSDKIEFERVQAIAVADGHGGKDYFRSQIGSKLAIEVLFSQLKKFCRNMAFNERFSDMGIRNFKYDFVNEWRKAVKKDWYDRLSNGKPLGKGEIRYESVSDKYKSRYTSDNPQIVENYLYTAYGTTLICAVSIGSQILFLQIGDGTCVLLQRDGEFRLPVPSDDENFLNVTVSLCDKDAERKIRHAVMDCDTYSPNSPAAIFLSTDGLDDCFPYYQNEEHLYKLYADVVIDDMIKNRFQNTDDEIREKLLPELTQKASQDDISLAYFILPTVWALRETFNKIDARYKTPTEPTEKIPETAQEKVVKSFTPPKISSKTVTPVKTTESTINVHPIMNSAPPTPFVQKSPPNPEPPQTLIKANNVAMGAPVQVGGTPQSASETFKLSTFKTVP